MKNEKQTQDQPLRETVVSGSVLKNKLTAHQCYKLKEEKNLSDEEFRNLLVENGIILSKFGEIELLLRKNMKAAVLGTMLRKGVDEITNDCLAVSKEYDKSKSELNNKIISDYIHEFAWEFGRLWNTKLTYEQKMERIGEKIKLPDEFLAGLSETDR